MLLTGIFEYNRVVAKRAWNWGFPPQKAVISAMVQNVWSGLESNKQYNNSILDTQCGRRFFFGGSLNLNLNLSVLYMIVQRNQKENFERNKNGMVTQKWS